MDSFSGRCKTFAQRNVTSTGTVIDVTSQGATKATSTQSCLRQGQALRMALDLVDTWQFPTLDEQRIAGQAAQPSEVSDRKRSTLPLCGAFGKGAGNTFHTKKGFPQIPMPFTLTALDILVYEGFATWKSQCAAFDRLHIAGRFQKVFFSFFQISGYIVRQNAFHTHSAVRILKSHNALTAHILYRNAAGLGYLPAAPGHRQNGCRNPYETKKSFHNVNFRKRNILKFFNIVRTSQSMESSQHSNHCVSWDCPTLTPNVFPISSKLLLPLCSHSLACRKRSSHREVQSVTWSEHDAESYFLTGRFPCSVAGTGSFLPVEGAISSSSDATWAKVFSHD